MERPDLLVLQDHRGRKASKGRKECLALMVLLDQQVLQVRLVLRGLRVLKASPATRRLSCSSPTPTVLCSQPATGGSSSPCLLCSMA